MIFFACVGDQLVSQGSYKKAACRDPVQPSLKCFKLLPELFDVFERDFHCTMVDLPQRAHLLLLFPRGGGLRIVVLACV